MPLKCAICGLENHVEVVCHHCGRPLCDSEQCRFVLGHDRAFVPPPNLWQRLHNWGKILIGQQPLPDAIAYHCPSCKYAYHRYQHAIPKKQWGKEPMMDNKPLNAHGERPMS